MEFPLCHKFCNVNTFQQQDLLFKNMRNTRQIFVHAAQITWYDFNVDNVAASFKVV